MASNQIGSIEKKTEGLIFAAREGILGVKSMHPKIAKAVKHREIK